MLEKPLRAGRVEEALPNIDFKFEAEVRGEGNNFVNLEPKQPSNGAACQDKVKGVARRDGGFLATEELAFRFGGNVGAGELVEVDVPVSCRNPVGDGLDQCEEVCQNGGVGLRA